MEAVEQALESAQAAGIDLTAIATEEVLEGLGLQKAKQPGVVAGKTQPVTRSLLYDTNFWSDARGVREALPPITYSLLRDTRKKNPVIGACVNLRRRQVRAFSEPSEDMDEPGYRVRLADRKARPSPKQRDDIKYLEEFFYYTGRTDFKGADNRDDQLIQVLTKLSEDYLTVDAIGIEVRRDASGAGVDFWLVDPATIRRVIAGGFGGSKNSFDPRAYVYQNDVQKMIAAARLAMLPEMDEVRFVQEINGRLTAAFTKRDLLLDHMNERTDVRYFGYGYPLIEQCVAVTTAFMFGLAYNMQAFDTGAVPKIGLVFKDANFSAEQLRQFQDQFIANFRGVYGTWRIPMLSGNVEALDLLKSPRDMEYDKYMQFTAALICAIFGVDPAELGLRLNAAQNVLSENNDAKFKYSKDRGLHDLLGQIANTMNRLLRLMGQVNVVQTGKQSERTIDLSEYRFDFTGLHPADRESMQKRMTERVGRDTTINEIRAEQDMPPIPGGDIILNPTYMQSLQMEQANQQQAGAEDGAAESGGFDWDSLIDEAADAIDEEEQIQKARTQLL